MKQLLILFSLACNALSYNEEPCRGIAGFCLSTSKCPGRNFLSGKCPTQSASVKCCMSLPYQENACRAAGGNCADETRCEKEGGEAVSRKCPTQPKGIKCCIKSSAPIESSNWVNMNLGKTCACWSRIKSEAVARSQQQKSLKYKTSIRNASVKYGIPAGIIKGVISRESGFGTLLGKWGSKPGWGDNNNAFGLMQIDKRHHQVDTSTIDNIDAGVKILADYLKKMKKKHPSWSLEWQLRGAVASYNAGPGNVRTQEFMDKGTASSCKPCTGNYSWDTMARAQWFAKN